MSVQKVPARPSSVWKPLPVGDFDVEARVNESREGASAVLFMLLRGRHLPAELIGRSLSWLRVVEQQAHLDGERLIPKLGADVGLKTDPVGEALRSLKRVIDECASKFETADAERQASRTRSMVWASTLLAVKESLDGANSQACSSLPQRLHQEIGDLIRDFEDDLCGYDWQACCETMAVLDRLVTSELVMSPNAHSLGQRKFPESRPRGNTERALVSLRTLAVDHAATLVERMMLHPTLSGVHEQLKTAVDVLEREATRASADLDAAMNGLISEWIRGLRSAADDDNGRSYCKTFTALRQTLATWIHQKRSERRGTAEPL